MNIRQRVWVTLATVLHWWETAVTNKGTSPTSDLTRVEQELRKLSKMQFKANMLAENQVAQWQQMVTVVQETQKQNEALLALIKDGRETAFAQQILSSILPALDSIENAIKSGQQYLAVRDRAFQAPSLTVEKAQRLVSPADRTVLAAWLDGLRFIQERHLAILEVGGVTPIPTVGHPFDPFKHRAVSIKPAGENSPNSIACEERRGYETTNGVLRYADVVVYK